MENPLDRIDFGILEALQENGRLSNKELAARVNLAPSSCFERVRRLRECGALGRAYTVVDHHVLGIGLQALMTVQLTRHSRELVQRFWDHAIAQPEVLAAYHVAGEDDFLLHVAVRDADHLRDLAMDAFTTREEVSRIHTSLIYDVRRNRVLPRYVGDD